MLQVTIKSNKLTDEEKEALQYISEYLKNGFFKEVVYEGEVEDEYIHLYRILGKKTYNSRNAGKPAKLDKDEICEYALKNAQLSITEISKHFKCSRQYITKLLNEKNKMYTYKKYHKTLTED